MNAFTNSIFSILFSWLRSLVESLWQTASSASFSGLLTWLGDHWMLVIAVLCIAGTVLDYLVWLLRWQPYVLWRQRIAKWLGHSPQRTKDEITFDRGYRDGVDLHMPEGTMEQAPAWDEAYAMPESAWQTPQAPNPSEPPIYRQAYPASYEEDMTMEDSAMPPQVFQAAPPPEPVPGVQKTMLGSTPYPPADTIAAPVTRRRRSDRHEKKAPALPERLLSAEDEEDILLSGLPPLKRSSEAFHQPVYPQTNAPSQWPKAQDENRHESSNE